MQTTEIQDAPQDMKPSQRQYIQEKFKTIYNDLHQLFTSIFVDVSGVTYIGYDSGTTNYSKFGTDGDLTFHGTAGLCFGQIYVEGIDVGIGLAAQDTYYQVAAWSPGAPDGVNGESNNSTPDVTNDHIVIDTAGKYYVSWHVSCYSGAKTEYEFEPFTNNGTTGFPQAESYRTTSVASAIGLVSGGGICDLSAGDTLELWVERKDGAAVAKTITIRAATLTAIQVSGT